MKYTFLLAALLLPVSVLAQNVSKMTFDSYSSELSSYRKGLSQNTIQCIMQDSRGYLWVGTWDGLNRFDGYSFLIFKPDYSNPKGNISNESINALAEDDEGNIWVGTNKGLNRYKYKSKSFDSYFVSYYNTNSIPSDSISALVFDEWGRLWIGTNHGLCSYDKDHNLFKRYNYSSRNKASIPSDQVTALYIDKGGKLWIGTENGAAYMNLVTGKILRTKSDFYEQGKDVWVTSFAESGNKIWMGTFDGICVADKQTISKSGEFSSAKGLLPDELASQVVIRLLKDNRGWLWIATPENGIYIYYPKSGEFRHVYSDFNSRYGLVNNGILSVAEAMSGEVWIGTVHGLSMFSDIAYKFPHFRISGDQFNNNHNLIWAFQPLRNGNLLIGTYGGLIEFDIESQQFSHFSQNDFGTIPVLALKILPDGNIWVGTSGKGLYLLDQNGKVKKKFTTDDPGGIAGNFVWCITTDSKNNLWLACTGGVSCIDLSNFRCKNWLYPGYESKGNISSKEIYDVMVDKTGIVWISTFNGLNRLDPSTGKIYVFHHDKGNPVSISNDRALSSFEDSKGNIWIGTFGGGLNKFDRKAGVFTKYSINEGFPDNVVYNIVEDHFGCLWLTSNSGLIRFMTKDNIIARYDVNDGIQSHEFNGGAAEILTDGQIVVGGMNGFNLFNPKDIIVNKQVPKVVITEFKIFGKPFSWNIENGDVVELRPEENFFSISFAALDYTNPAKNQYSYILEGYDKEWIYCDAMRRTAEYTDVKPGTYIFRVRGSNNDGIWNKDGISFTIIVKPPFYKTWLFRILLIAIAIIITYLFIRGRVKKERQKNEVASRMLLIEKQMFELEQKALQLQMNPHFIFNSLNSIQSYILSNDTENAINYLAKFSQLMRLILSTSREAYIPLSQEISLLKYYLDLENMRFNNRFIYEIRVDPGLDTEFIGIPPMIIQPYIENAILHGLMNKRTGECRLIIQLWEKEDCVICIVEDNGIGRAKAMEIKQKSGLIQKSQGIVITSQRLDILNAHLKNKISVEITDLTDHEGNATGTRVKLTIPVVDI